MGLGDWVKSLFRRETSRTLGTTGCGLSKPSTGGRDHATLGRLLQQFDAEVTGYLRHRQTDLAEAACRRQAQTLADWLERARTPDVRNLVAAGTFDLASFFRTLRKKEDAERLYGQAETIWRALAEADPDNGQYASWVAGCRNHLGLLAQDFELLPQAAELFRQALAMRELLCERFPDDESNTVYLGGALCNLGNVAGQQHDDEAALAWYHRSIDVLDRSIPGCDCGCRDLFLNLRVSQGGSAPPALIAEQYLRNALGGRAWILQRRDPAGRFRQVEVRSVHEVAAARILAPRVVCGAESSPSELEAFQELRRELLDVVAFAGGRIIFDLSGVTDMDGRGAGLLLHLRGRLVGAGHFPLMCGLSEAVRRATRPIDWDQKFESFPTLEAALAAAAE
ncbi:MAG: anti-sigma factor antagonist [Planctomycetaceae bacterium]|nr:anti-sigma factor antagonist [Planctomycetaceae bacterium]